MFRSGLKHKFQALLKPKIYMIKPLMIWCSSEISEWKPTRSLISFSDWMRKINHLSIKHRVCFFGYPLITFPPNGHMITKAVTIHGQRPAKRPDDYQVPLPYGTLCFAQFSSLFFLLPTFFFLIKRLRKANNPTFFNFH